MKVMLKFKDGDSRTFETLAEAVVWAMAGKTPQITDVILQEVSA